MTEKNNMENDELKELFARFNPEMTSADDFIARLETRLSAVEDVKARSRMHSARMKKAVGIAIFFGFLVGVVLTASFPWIMAGVNALLSGISPSVSEASTVVSWIVVSLATVFSAFAAYDLSLSPAVQSRIKSPDGQLSRNP